MKLQVKSGGVPAGSYIGKFVGAEATETKLGKRTALDVGSPVRSPCGGQGEPHHATRADHEECLWPHLERHHRQSPDHRRRA